MTRHDHLMLFAGAAGIGSALTSNITGSWVTLGMAAMWLAAWVILLLTHDR